MCFCRLSLTHASNSSLDFLIVAATLALSAAKKGAAKGVAKKDAPKKGKKDKSGPKKNMSAFMFFINVSCICEESTYCANLEGNLAHAASPTLLCACSPISFPIILSLQDKRAEIKKAHPEYGIGEVGKAGGAMWQALKAKGEKDKEFKKYNDMAEKDKARYEKEKAKMSK